MVRETYCNETEGYRFGDSEWYEAYTDDKGRLFKDMQKEYGRCSGKMYVEPDGKQVGWVFVKSMQYEDARSKDEVYIREVWVEVREVVNGLEDMSMLSLREVV